MAEYRGWKIVQVYEDQDNGGAKERDQRPAFDQMLKDAVRRRFDILMVYPSIDRNAAFCTWRTPWWNLIQPASPSTSSP